MKQCKICNVNTRLVYEGEPLCPKHNPESQKKRKIQVLKYYHTDAGKQSWAKTKLRQEEKLKQKIIDEYIKENVTTSLFPSI
jgi:hypothetical protein